MSWDCEPSSGQSQLWVRTSDVCFPWLRGEKLVLLSELRARGRGGALELRTKDSLQSAVGTSWGSDCGPPVALRGDAEPPNRSFGSPRIAEVGFARPTGGCSATKRSIRSS